MPTAMLIDGISVVHDIGSVHCVVTSYTLLKNLQTPERWTETLVLNYF